MATEVCCQTPPSLRTIFLIVVRGWFGQRLRAPALSGSIVRVSSRDGRLRAWTAVSVGSTRVVDLVMMPHVVTSMLIKIEPGDSLDAAGS